MSKATNFYFGLYNFSVPPYYLRNGLSYGLLTQMVHSQGPSEQNAVNNLWQKESWAYPGAAESFFSVSPIISGTDKATDF